MKMESPTLNIIWLTIILILCICVIIEESDNIDIDDELGPYMCEQHGKEFFDYKYENDDFGNIELKIYCKEIKQESLDDGYLVLLK